MSPPFTRKHVCLVVTVTSVGTQLVFAAEQRPSPGLCQSPFTRPLVDQYCHPGSRLVQTEPLLEGAERWHRRVLGPRRRCAPKVLALRENDPRRSFE